MRTTYRMPVRQAVLKFMPNIFGVTYYTEYSLRHVTKKVLHIIFLPQNPCFSSKCSSPFHRQRSASHRHLHKQGYIVKQFSITTYFLWIIVHYIFFKGFPHLGWVRFTLLQNKNKWNNPKCLFEWVPIRLWNTRNVDNPEFFHHFILASQPLSKQHIKRLLPATIKCSFKGFPH